MDAWRGFRTAATSRLVAAYVSRPRRQAAHALAAVRRRIRGGPREILYFHEVGDPYSALLAPLLPEISRRYGVEVRFFLVPPPTDAFAPERERLRRYALRDAARLAARRGLEFPASPQLSARNDIEEAERTLAGSLESPEVFELAARLGRRLATGTRDDPTSALPAGEAGSEAARQAALIAGEATRRDLGHYLGGMIYFEGEWYWGVDRLHHLETRLGAAPPLAPFLAESSLSAPPPPPADRRPLVEFWFSFRSPYSWLAFPRVRELCRRYEAELRLRYILPMVMRGLPIPPAKRLYITLDAKREAEMVELPYGRIVDPVGRGAERALAVLHGAAAQGRGEAFAELGLRAAFADGIDLGSDGGLLDVARRAGLSDSDVAAALADEAWRDAAEANRSALFEAGLWGAPTFRVDGGPAYWGQDRLWILEEDLVAARRRV